MEYEVLSPWAEVDYSGAKGLSKRLDALDGKVIGLFAHFKEHSPLMLAEIANQLSAAYPTATFLPLQYPKDTKEIDHDPDFKPVFLDWLDKIDGVISAYGDAGSCAMFLAYNTAYIENLGKPTVMLCKSDVANAARRGAGARMAPAMRIVESSIIDCSFLPALDEEWMEKMIRPVLKDNVGALADALVRPLTEEERTPPAKSEDYAGIKFTGNLWEVNDYFYKMGWTNGSPIIPPTREAVDEMLTGTDLPADTIVAKLPPMLGNATVEKIAVNAVMCGCLPTYMPVLIAAVRGMMDPRIHLGRIYMQRRELDAGRHDQRAHPQRPEHDDKRQFHESLRQGKRRDCQDNRVDHHEHQRREARL